MAAPHPAIGVPPQKKHKLYPKGVLNKCTFPAILVAPSWRDTRSAGLVGRGAEMSRQHDWDDGDSLWAFRAGSRPGAWPRQEEDETAAQLADAPDELWDAFLLDDDSAEPEPQDGDFWLEPEDE
jgi:hypothetical protein